MKKKEEKMKRILLLMVGMWSIGLRAQDGPHFPEYVRTDSITTLANNADLPLYGRGTGTVVLEGLSYPSSDGSANYYMRTNGSGTLTLGQVAFSHLSGTAGETQGGTGQSTYTTGDILYSSSSNTLSKLAAGTNGYVLTMSGGVPTWAAASSGFSVSGTDTDGNLITADGAGGGTRETGLTYNGTALGVTGNITVSGTVDGRDIATDGMKLDGIEAGADVTDEANVVSALDGATLTSATVATGDKVIIQDVDDSDNIKTVTAQSIADLATASITFPTNDLIAFGNSSGTDLDYSSYLKYASNGLWVSSTPYTSDGMFMYQSTGNTFNFNYGALGSGGVSFVVNTDDGDVDFSTNDIDNIGSIYVTEKSAASADVTARGQIWVKNTTPNELWFTDDAGTDFQLGAGGGSDNLGNHTATQALDLDGNNILNVNKTVMDTLRINDGIFTNVSVGSLDSTRDLTVWGDVIVKTDFTANGVVDLDSDNITIGSGVGTATAESEIVTAAGYSYKQQPAVIWLSATTGALVVQDSVISWPIPYNCTLDSAKAWVETAGTTSAIELKILENGGAVTSSNISISAGSSSSSTVTSFADADLAYPNRLYFSRKAVDSGGTGEGHYVQLWYTRD